MSMLIWAALGYFPGPDLERGFLGRFGYALGPLGESLGMDWRMLVALLSSFIAKENAIATLGILYDGESGGGLTDILSARVSPAAALAFLTATMLFVTCAATIAVMRQETGQWRWVFASVGLNAFRRVICQCINLSDRPRIRLSIANV